mmetsp:Transcript_18530/g.37664  ORF Transcript_18530/g.37664 Transcript_18530/m.37664 type:complete len:1503 (+) Transcript_18530:3729-8237(+)
MDNISADESINYAADGGNGTSTNGYIVGYNPSIDNGFGFEQVPINNAFRGVEIQQNRSDIISTLSPQNNNCWTSSPQSQHWYPQNQNVPQQITSTWGEYDQSDGNPAGDEDFNPPTQQTQYDVRQFAENEEAGMDFPPHPNDEYAHSMPATNVVEAEMLRTNEIEQAPAGVTADFEHERMMNASAENVFDNGDLPRPEIDEVEALNPDADDFDPFVGDEECDHQQHDPNRKQKPVFRIVINPTGESYTGTSDEAVLLKWHYRLGHVNMRYLLKIAPGIPGMEELTKIKSTTVLPKCDACAMGKGKAKPLPKATFKRAANPMDRMHLDMSGIINCKSYGGHQYFLVIVDDATGYKWSYCLRKKSDYLECIDHLFTRLGDMPKILRGTPRALRTDNAGEMLSAAAREYMRKHKIWHELCNAYEHHQNPRAEAAIGEIGMRARTMLQFSGVSRRHWPQSVMYATEIANRTLPTSRGSSETCFEAFHGVKPDNGKAMPFGCLAYLHRSKALRKQGKFDDTAIRCVFLGFAFHLGHKGYLLGSLTSRKFYVATNVNFAEGEFPYRPKQTDSAAAEFWGEDEAGRAAKPVPFGPSIEAWNDDDEGPDQVEILLEEEDDDTLAETHGVTVDDVDEARRSSMQTRAMTRSNPVPTGMVELRGDPGTISLDGIGANGRNGRNVSNVSNGSNDDNGFNGFGNVDVLQPIPEEPEQFSASGDVLAQPGNGDVNLEIEHEPIESGDNVMNEYGQDAGVANQPDYGIHIPRDELVVDVSGEVLNPGVPMPAVIDDSLFYYEYLAFFSTTLLSVPAHRTTKYASNPDKDWIALLAINPGEIEEIEESGRHVPLESDGRDPMLAFLGIDPIDPNSRMLYDRAFNLVTEVEPWSFSEALRRRDKDKWAKATMSELHRAFNLIGEMEPTSYAEANTRWDKEEWMKATFVELNQLEAMGCYEAVHLPRGKRAIKSRIVYKLKLDRDGKPARYKARIVAKGFMQRHGVDYVDTFSATAHPTAIRTMIALAAKNRWLTNSTDIRNAFISAPIGDSEVYVEPPPGLERSDGKVWKLRSSLYGLNTSGRQFFKLLCQHMKEFGFTCTTSDECVFSYRTDDGQELHVMTVVDDMIQVTNSQALLDTFLDYLRQKFEITNDGEINWFLGVAYNKNPDTLNWHATQTAYLDRSLEKYDMERETAKDVPMDPSFKITVDDLDDNPSESVTHLYRSMIGTLLYLAVWTRPDIAMVVNMLARYMTRASPRLIKAARNVFRYLKGTRTDGITFFHQDPLRDERRGHGLSAELIKGALKKNDRLTAYSDASDADDPVKRRSTGGYIVMYNGSPVSWNSGLQRLTTLSTCESEYVQAALTVKEVLYLRELLAHAGHAERCATPIYEDNQAAMKLSENPVNRGMTKHIARRFHFIRQANDDFQIALIPINTAKNTADAFTKPLGQQLFTRHKHGMGVRDVRDLCKREDEERKLCMQLSRVNMFRARPTDFAYTMREQEGPSWRRAACGTCVYRV